MGKTTTHYVWNTTNQGGMIATQEHKTHRVVAQTLPDTEPDEQTWGWFSMAPHSDNCIRHKLGWNNPNVADWYNPPDHIVDKELVEEYYKRACQMNEHNQPVLLSVKIMVGDIQLVEARRGGYLYSDEIEEMDHDAYDMERELLDQAQTAADLLISALLHFRGYRKTL